MKEFDPTFTSWGPFINHETFIIQPVTRSDLATGCTVFSLTIFFALTAGYQGLQQTKRARYPWRSAYIWMLWLEWAACLVIAVECILYLVRVVRPSFYFFMSLLLMWTIQTQLLLQIIINRIRIILHNRKKGKQLMLWTLGIMTVINISVFCIWMPARMQINATWMHINEIWDRVEKGIYLLIDAGLNYYFIKTVKSNLVANGLQKYDKLVRFNQFIIVISLLMDVLIIGAMSLPNGLVYASFHPLAYLVKLNIEMSMARLIKKIALGTDNPHNRGEFASYSSNSATQSRGGKLSTWIGRQRSTFKDLFGNQSSPRTQTTMDQGTIKKTAEFTVTSSPMHDVELSSQLRGEDKTAHVVVTERGVHEGHGNGIGLQNERAGSRMADIKKQGSREQVKDYTSDEEVLIKPQPARTRARTSQDSSEAQSMASEKRHAF